MAFTQNQSASPVVSKMNLESHQSALGGCFSEHELTESEHGWRLIFMAQHGACKRIGLVSIGVDPKEPDEANSYQIRGNGAG
jgi:hypothetical protein